MVDRLPAAALLAEGKALSVQKLRGKRNVLEAKVFIAIDDYALWAILMEKTKEVQPFLLISDLGSPPGGQKMKGEGFPFWDSRAESMMFYLLLYVVLMFGININFIWISEELLLP